MKTAISIPDATYDAATRRARELGMSRSEFFCRAARHYLDELDSSSVTARMDRALLDDDDADGGSSFVVAAGRRFLRATSHDTW